MKSYLSIVAAAAALALAGCVQVLPCRCVQPATAAPAPVFCPQLGPGDEGRWMQVFSVPAKAQEDP